MTADITLASGRTLTNIHPEGTCIGEHCCIHNPSDHPLKNAPMEWYPQISHMVRVCEHGFQHPDPDDIQFKMMIGDFMAVEAISSVHLVRENCDGCCFDD